MPAKHVTKSEATSTRGERADEARNERMNPMMVRSADIARDCLNEDRPVHSEWPERIILKRIMLELRCGKKTAIFADEFDLAYGCRTRVENGRHL
jgi:hypothetical protein